MRKLALMESTLLFMLPSCFDFVGWTMSNLLPIYVCMDETIVCLLLDMLASYICCIWTFDLVCICVGWSYPYGRDMIWYVYVLLCLLKVFSNVYIYICEILWNWMNLRKNRGCTGSLPSAGRRQRALPSASRRQSCHVAATCATWGTGWPIWLLCRLLADGKEHCTFAVCHRTA